METPSSLQATPSVLAALLLLVRELLPGGTEWPRTAADALRLTGAGKSQAYEVLGRLRTVLPSVLGLPGRPASAALDQASLETLLMAVRDYLFEHPGATCGTAERRTYSDAFRRFIVGLTGPGQPAEGKSVADLAYASGVPLGTLKDWLRPPEGAAARSRDATAPQASPEPPDWPSVPTDAPSEAEEPPQVCDWIRTAHLQLIATLWLSWKGPFQAFCQMLRTEHRLPYGATYIGNFLQSLGLRQRRPRTPVEAPWSSNTFRTLFPGAQWLGDGTTIALCWDGQRFLFNIEALLDPASNSLVGFAVSDAEDGEAVRLAYEMGVATTGNAPLATSLDNKPSNHSPATLQALADTILLRSTPGRGQAKAPLEGAFGLFQQAMPPLVLSGPTSRDVARSALELVMTAWALGRNGKPRRRLKGRTPAQAYADARPTQQELHEARTWFEELHRRQEQARLTREARRDPVRKALLQQGLADLGILDPEHKLAVALACYGRDAIVRGLATLRAKLDLETAPPEADRGRYLGGIIRNLHTRLEIEHISVRLLEQRIRLRDLTLAPLVNEANRIRAEMSLSDMPQACVDRALQATHLVDFRYWTQVAAESLASLPAREVAVLYRSLGRRVAASFKTDRERRQDLIDRLADVAATVA